MSVQLGMVIVIKCVSIYLEVHIFCSMTELHKNKDENVHRFELLEREREKKYCENYGILLEIRITHSVRD